MHNYFTTKGWSKSCFDFPVKDSSLAREIEALAQEAEALGYTYQRRFIPCEEIETKAKPDDEQLKHTAIITASTNDVDRDQEVILPNGLDRKFFRKNPVILWAHDSSQPPLGYSLWEKVEDQRSLKARIKFADRPADWPPIEWFPDTIFALAEQKVIRGVSIGFLPLDARPPQTKEIEANPSWAAARRIITKAALMEISICPVGCNQAALIEGVSKGLIDPEAAKAYGFDYEPEPVFQEWEWKTADFVIPKKVDQKADLLKKMLKK